MSNPFIGEIKIFAGNFAIRGWAFCDGQLINISQNPALFTILGCIYGGDCRTTFGVPNLKGRLAVHAGTGPGRSPRKLGQVGGADAVTLTARQLPSHSHTMSAVTAQGDLDKPASNTAPAATPGGGRGLSIYGAAERLVRMASTSLPSTGGGQAHNNDQPHQVLNFLIALQGIYPSRG